jgi:hypothetical protein
MASNPQHTKAACILALASLLLLAACSDPNAALNERVAKAEAAAQRAEAAAAKAEQAVAKLEQAKSAPSMVDGGPQLTPEPVQQPQPMVQSAVDETADRDAPNQ